MAPIPRATRSAAATNVSDERVAAFHDRLRGKGVHSLVRWTSANGRDTDGACGQLALSSYDNDAQS